MHQGKIPDEMVFQFQVSRYSGHLGLTDMQLSVLLAVLLICVQPQHQLCHSLLFYNLEYIYSSEKHLSDSFLDFGLISPRLKDQASKFILHYLTSVY